MSGRCGIQTSYSKWSLVCVKISSEFEEVLTDICSFVKVADIMHQIQRGVLMTDDMLNGTAFLELRSAQDNEEAF